MSRLDFLMPRRSFPVHQSAVLGLQWHARRVLAAPCPRRLLAGVSQIPMDSGPRESQKPERFRVGTWGSGRLGKHVFIETPERYELLGRTLHVAAGRVHGWGVRIGERCTGARRAQSPEA